jgi:hypothetical protein
LGAIQSREFPLKPRDNVRGCGVVVLQRRSRVLDEARCQAGFVPKTWVVFPQDRKPTLVPSSLRLRQPSHRFTECAAPGIQIVPQSTKEGKVFLAGAYFLS